MLTNFCGIRIPTTGNFKSLMGCHCWWNWEENAHRVQEAGTSKLPCTTRSENGWDHLGPSFTCSWTNVSSSNRIKRNYKNNLSHIHWGQLWTIRYKKAKNQLLLLRRLEQKQSPTHDPCTQDHHGRWADHLSHPSGLTHWSTATLTPCKKPAHPTQGVSKGICFLFLLPLAAA